MPASAPPAGIAPPVGSSPPKPLAVPDVRALAADPELRWERLAAGIEIHRLYQWPAGQSAALLRYAPGTRLQRHRHAGSEQILVLSGSQSDDVGHHAAGSLVVHPAGSAHAVQSDEGCVVLAIWERPVEFVD